MADANELRAKSAQDALILFGRERGEVDEHQDPAGFVEQNLTDLITNLAHYCDLHSISLNHSLLLAKEHYRAETNKHGRQFD